MVECENGDGADAEHEIKKNVLIEALREVQEKHEVQLQKIIEQLHAEHERKLASVVEREVRKAIAEVRPASSGALVLPVANDEARKAPVPYPNAGQCSLTPSDIPKHHLSQSSSAPSKPAFLKESSHSMTLTNDTPLPGKGGKSIEQNVKEVNDSVAAVTKLAREDTFAREYTGAMATLDYAMNHPWCDYFIALFIFGNSLLIAIQTEVAASQMDPKEDPGAFRALDLFFTIFFTVELVLRIFVERDRFILGHNKGWNLFDFFVVFSALLEEFLGAMTNTTAIRVLRIMRLVRVVRVIRTLRIFNDLRAMVQGIFASLLSLVWALVLLFIIFFVIGIFITQIVTTRRRELTRNAWFYTDGTLQEGIQSEEEEQLLETLNTQFGSLGKTIYSLYKAISGGDDWSSFADPLFEVSTIMGVFFCLYIAFAVLAVLNVITGVFVDNAIKASQQDADTIILEQTESRKKHIEDVKSVFNKADLDNSGKLDWEEFKTHIDNPYVQAYFRQLDLDVEGSSVEGLFNLLDFDGNGTLDLDEFIFGCAKMKGYAKSIDLIRLKHGQREISKLFVETFSEQNDRIDAMLGNFQMLLTHLGLPLYQKPEQVTPPPQLNPASSAPSPAPASPNPAPIQPAAPEGPPPGLPGSVFGEAPHRDQEVVV